MVEEFFIDGGARTDPGTAWAPYLALATDLLGDWRADSTWRRYSARWRKVKQFLTHMLALEGLELCADALRAHKDLFPAVAAWAYQESTAVTAVETAVLALRMCLRINGIAFDDDVRTRAVREAARRNRTKATIKMAAFTSEEVRLILLRWDVPGGPLWQRLIAISIAVAFCILARWSDLRGIPLGSIYWCPEGAMLTLARRKNRQHGAVSLPLGDTGRADSLVSRLRRLVTDFGYVVPAEGYIRTSDWLFRAVGPRTGHKHPHMADWHVRTRGVHPMEPADYDNYKSAWRGALRAIGMPEAAVACFATQSARAGGDTALHAAGASAELRRDIGQWATPLIERGYLRLRIRARLQFMKTFGL
jgi:hypothetical protein